MDRSHSVVCKMVLIVAMAVVANLLFFSADARIAAVTLPSLVQDPEPDPEQCNITAVPFSTTFEECDACCRKAGHPGGYIKGDKCICNSGSG